MPYDNSAQAELQKRLSDHTDGSAGKDASLPVEAGQTGDKPDFTLEVAPSVTGLMFRGQRRVLYQEVGCWSRNYAYDFDELASLGKKYGLPFDLAQGDAAALMHGFLLACRARGEDENSRETSNRRWSDTGSGISKSPG